MEGTYFDFTRDKKFSYFCQGCLVGKTEEYISKKDVRYCITCQPLVEKGYDQLRQKYTPIPYNGQNHREDTHINADIQIPIGEQKTKMSTLNSTSPTVDNFRWMGRPKVYKKRLLPEDKINQLNKEGIGAKAIATYLKTEADIFVSYKTVQRVLSGERRGE
jgi:hypothetical protein